MLTSHAIALLFLTLLLLAWLGVQRASFAEGCSDEDPLDGRLGCSGAACPKRREGGEPCPLAEEKP